MTPPILIFEITLLNTFPPVWRIIEVKQNATLHDLHAAIQVAMGWKNAHMYSFLKGEGEHRVEFILPEAGDTDDISTGNNPREFKLKDLFKKPGEHLEYLYDWGDSWKHQVLFKGRKYDNAIFGYPQCVAGARSCPPEDVGGIPGYEELLKAIATKDVKKLKEYDEWLGYRYDPDKFEAERYKVFFGKQARKISRE